jgi:adhesin transport system membrane fusion protein
MLNISDNSINHLVRREKYASFDEILDPKPARRFSIWMMVLFLSFILFLFVPWTQNIRASGQLTTLQPGGRPQAVVSTIDGRIEGWFVNEGDTLQKGDTIAVLSEIKDDYFDPQLLNRTEEQLTAKQSSALAYQRKADALGRQIQALRSALTLKQAQAENKITQSRLKVDADSVDLEAAKIALQIAEIQFQRWDSLYTLGLKSRTDWEVKRNKLQESRAKLISAERKFSIARQALQNALLVRDNVQNEYRDKISKAESDRESALSSGYDADAQSSKLQNQLANYEARIGFRYIISPQHGSVNRALITGVGETVKAGQAVISLTPMTTALAAELFVRPVDLPLIRRGVNVRLEFDGWPAIVFSGWPNTSFGTFGGKIFAVENDISKSGKYRVLVQPGGEDGEWPAALRVGSGVRGFALLQDVPLWYELWRQLNGFPPEFYLPNSTPSEAKQKK